MAMLEGTLSKWTNVMKGWQYRWFVLDENAGLLSYYTSKEKMMKGVRRGCVRLKGAVIGIDDQEDNTFTITVDHKTFHFQARDADEREKWVRRLEDTIRRHANRSRIWDSQSTFYIGGLNPHPSKRANHLELLDRRVSEADAYLQLIIEQTNKIEKQIEELEPDEKAKCSRLQETANAMVDHIKHSIVSLQIAKNMANPINGIYHGPSHTAGSALASSFADCVDEADLHLPLGVSLIKTDNETSSECGEASRQAMILPTSLDISPTPLGLGLGLGLGAIVPETSYSSSEGEDDFYDANDDPFSVASSPVGIGATRGFSLEVSPTNETPTPSAAVATANEAATEITAVPIVEEEEAVTQEAAKSPTSDKRAPIKFRSDGSIDYDALYEEEDDSDISMESHGSMVTHLLSQVKIGMDLTKVVLPTFILERRSLLEMYADYFAHPDLFLKIADLEDPKDRIVQVCRWYLSAYHAGRKSSVAKKPYNPILGEVFQCHWDVVGEPLDPETVPDGPIPWCKRNQLTFLAEQVSHHPPISAFYAEHYSKKISFAAHVWTKSKFLGLSIGVHNIGQGIVTLCERNEEYTVSFPNGYGRSILTVPWIELGGSVTINCPQTGYHADVEFLTKPFYGGKRNRVTCEIYAPNEKKSFVSISGEWCGLMEAKWHDATKNKTEVFVDVNRIPIFKKQVRPIVEQDEFESRRVWKEVTAGLKLNDIERATNAKSNVEQKQREEAKQRKETDANWDTKYFKPVGENWIYTKPLSQRLYLQEKENKR